MAPNLLLLDSGAVLVRGAGVDREGWTSHGEERAHHRLSVDDDFEDFSHCFTGECRINVLPTLYKISQVIAASEDLEHLLEIILNVMQKRLKITRGAVTLYDRSSETISIHRSFGLTDIEKFPRRLFAGRGHYRRGG